MIKAIKTLGIIGLTALLLLGFTHIAHAAPGATTANKPPEKKLSAKADLFVDKFIQYMVKKHRFEADYLYNLFDQVTINTDVTEKMDRPFEAKPWLTYKRFFVTDTRIQNGARYWQEHEHTLKRAEKKYGVSPSIIVAILGIETNYGEHQGNFPVLESLSTLAFNYPSRAEFFKKELEHFLLMTREQKLDPLKIQGSYAGAIGMAQFMPSSYRHYAVDFSGEQQVDLCRNHEDAIGSIANYLSKNGWERHGPIATKAALQGNAYQQLLPNPLTPTYTVKQLAKYGVTPKARVRQHAKALFVELDNKRQAQNEYWIGFKNFYVISTYNHNRQYVMAVHQLANEIEKIRQVQLAKRNHPVRAANQQKS